MQQSFEKYVTRNPIYQPEENEDRRNLRHEDETVGMEDFRVKDQDRTLGKPKANGPQDLDYQYKLRNSYSVSNDVYTLPMAWNRLANLVQQDDATSSPHRDDLRSMVAHPSC